MKQLLHHNGYKLRNTTIHVTIYSPLKMYVVWEYLEKEYKKIVFQLIGRQKVN